jgi:hypothetical protein
MLGTNPNPLLDKAVSAWGNQCYDPNGTGNSADCIGYFKCVNNACAGGVRSGQTCYSINECPDVALADTVCERMPIDNISRLMATMIFSSGNAIYWQDFGKWFDGDCDLTTNQDRIYPCLRHAGSGTHATMRIMMKGNGWGPPGSGILQQQSAPYINFNDGSSDELKCVSGVAIASSGSGWSIPASPNGRNIGAIGYADCDILMGTPFSQPASGTRYPFENVHALKLDGVECKSAKVRNGEYPFYSNEYMYYDTNNLQKALIEDLAVFAGNPLNYAQVTFESGPNSEGNEGDFWAASSEMRFNKGSDSAWPAKTGNTVFPRNP